MLITTASFSAAAIIGVGIVVFWSNPQRVVNRVFLAMSVHIASWLTCVHFAVTRHEDPFWIRCASIISAFCPAHLWLLKMIFASGGAAPRRDALRPFFYWLGNAAVLTALSCTKWYVTAPAPGKAAEFGPGGFVYIVLAIASYAVAGRQIVQEVKAAHGGTRLELQVTLLGLSVAALVILALMAVRVLTHAIWPIHLQPLALLFVYTATVVAVTTSRIFDARQIVIFTAEKMATTVAALGALFFVDWVCRSFELSPRISLIVVAAITLLVAWLVDRALQRWFRFFPRAEEARRAVFAASEREVRWDRLSVVFENILRGWGQAEKTLLVCGPRSVILNAHDLLRSGVVLDELAALRWATPERLARERPTRERNALAEFLREQELGIVVLAQGSGQLALVGVGISGTRMPFTYPQATELIEIAAIMEGAFERTQLSAKVQHGEQLAMVGMVGASLAHEIRNPLVAIRTLVQMLPRQHHNPEFREKFFHVVNEEVQRIEQLARQFLELSAPREFKPTSVRLHTVIGAGLELVTPKAAQKGVRVFSELQANPDAAFTDPAAAKQVLLNLCLNAIQALEVSNPDRREVTIRTRNVGDRIEMSVSDSGPGIAPEVMARLFEPFQTTKATGFGLGLAVCSDMLTKLGSTITVDPPHEDAGATFRVEFPVDVAAP